MKSCFTCGNIYKCKLKDVRERKVYHIDEKTGEPVLIELRLWVEKTD